MLPRYDYKTSSNLIGERRHAHSLKIIWKIIYTPLQPPLPLHNQSVKSIL